MIQEIIENLLDQFHLNGGGDEKQPCFKLEAITADEQNPYYRELSDLISETFVSQKFWYNTVYNFLIYLQENELFDVDDIIDDNGFEELIIPIYTSELTEWLASNNHHIHYVGEAVSQFELDDGFAILQTAYMLAVEEICAEVIRVIETLEELE